MQEFIINVKFIIKAFGTLTEDYSRDTTVEKVIKMIDEEVERNVTVSEYTRNSEYIPNLIDEMKTVIKSYLDK